MATAAALTGGLGGLGPLLPSAAADDEVRETVARETVVPATYRDTHTWARLAHADTLTGGDGAGVLGVFHRMEGHSGLLWTRYSDGRSVDVPAAQSGLTSTLATGTDTIAYRYGDTRFDLWNAVDGTSSTIRVPEGQTPYGVVHGTVVVTYQNVTGEDGAVTKVKHLLTAGPDGTTRDVTVTGAPAGMTVGTPLRGDDTGLVFRASLDGTHRMVDVDPETGQVRGWTSPIPTGHLSTKLSPEHLVAYGGAKSTKVLVYSRADLSAPPVEVPLDTTSGDGGATAAGLSVVGDWLVHRPATGARVTAVPISGGAPLTLFAVSEDGVSAASDGTAVVVARTGADDWGIQRVHPGQDGRPAVTLVKALPKPPYRIKGLALDQGRLLVADESRSGVRDTYVRTVSATGTPEFGERSSHDGKDMMLYDCPPAEGGCRLYGTARNRAVWLTDDAQADDRVRASGPGDYDFWERSVPAGGQITDVSGDYVLHTTATRQTVLKIGDDAVNPPVTRAPGAAALSGDVLWTAGTTPGTVTSYDLTARKTTGTLTTDAGCAPTELQALGRYLYWSCEGKAGVYDRTAQKSVSVPTGEAKLGDGYVVTHDKAAGKLVLTTVTEGTPASRVVGELPDTGVSQRDVRWTVDESGANMAYVDDREQVHLVPSQVAQQPLRLLAPARSESSVEAHEIDMVYDTLTTVLLSKPASGWDLSVRNRASGRVHSDSGGGGAARGELTVGWSGDDPQKQGDEFLPNGSYDWTLTVQPADGVGAPLEVRGTVTLRHGRAERHDHVGPDGGADGSGDLLALDSSGRLVFWRGTGKGTFSGKVSGGGWSTKAVAVPFDDLNGDRCNDVLVRMADGSLRGYKVGCGQAPTTSMSYTKLGGTEFAQYDVLTSPGDVSGDGRADLLARNRSTGAVYLHKGTVTGKLAARVKLYDNWKTYKKVVGVGDLNGDGIGDLLAQDKANTLYRYYGKGNGTFSARSKLFTKWGGSYNAIVGVGDITGDGKADLVSRDTGGNLWRNSGNGKGSFGARTKIASGWQGNKGLF